MYTISSVAAAVTGARHLRAARNGQDAAAVWTEDAAGIAVVCDGCSAGAYSELGARLGSQLLLRIGREELARAPVPEIWTAVRARLVAELAAIADAMGPRDRVVREHLLFTVVAAAWRGDEVAVWAVGDGGYTLGDRVVELGPFADNAPPYLGYELLGELPPAHLEIASASCGRVAVATDGVIELGLAGLLDRRCFAHPDALRRRLALHARSGERIDWSEQRTVRTPAALQDDGAVAALCWERT